MEDKHSHGIPDTNSINRAFYIGIGLNSIFTLIEFIVGYRTNSLALIADASHNLSDVASLIISLIGMNLAKKAATKFYTYGYKKASIMASLINAILLVLIVVVIAREGIERIDSAPEVIGQVIIITALIGVVINTSSAFLFYKGQKGDINIKGAFLHLIVDALVSLGVVVSGVIIYYTQWNIVDPIISFIIAIVILISTWGLLKESITLVLDGVPKNIDHDRIISYLRKEEGVKYVHHVHIWALSSFENAITAHLVLKEELTSEKVLLLKREIRDKLTNENIQHITLEIENDSDKCENVGC